MTAHAIEANWAVSLDCVCPWCQKDVDLLAYPDFWDGRGGPNPFLIGEHGTERADHLEVVCPECGLEFEVTCVW